MPQAKLQNWPDEEPPPLHWCRPAGGASFLPRNQHVHYICTKHSSPEHWTMTPSLRAKQTLHLPLLSSNLTRVPLIIGAWTYSRNSKEPGEQSFLASLLRVLQGKKFPIHNKGIWNVLHSQKTWKHPLQSQQIFEYLVPKIRMQIISLLILCVNYMLQW